LVKLSLINIYPSSIILLLIFLISILPDIDGLWSKKLKDHHKGFFHSPIFWILITILLLFLTNKENAILFGCLILFHLICDLITGRTAGIPLFYPISSKEYSLIKTHPRWGDIDPNHPFSKKFRMYIGNYFKNTPLIAFEIILTLLGIASFILINLK
jgi:hypothetical protein